MNSEILKVNVELDLYCANALFIQDIYRFITIDNRCFLISDDSLEFSTSYHPRDFSFFVLKHKISMYL